MKYIFVTYVRNIINVSSTMHVFIIFAVLFSLPALAEISLSKTEKKWIKDNPIVKFTGNPNWLHYETFDKNDDYKSMSGNEISKLFNPFERLDAEDNIEGAGIGLTNTKYLVEIMGGETGVESTTSKGTTLWVELGIA